MCETRMGLYMYNFALNMQSINIQYKVAMFGLVITCCLISNSTTPPQYKYGCRCKASRVKGGAKLFMNLWGNRMYKEH